MNIDNLEEYVGLVVDATIGSGVAGQINAFKCGFNEVCFALFSVRFFSCHVLDCQWYVASKIYYNDYNLDISNIAFGENK